MTWLQVPNSDTLTWENALTYAEGLTSGGFSDWRLPNIKELQSLNDERIVTPSVSTTFFSTIGVKKYWSSTSLPNQMTRAWYLSTQFGITTYELKTARLAVICVRGQSSNTTVLRELNKRNEVIKVYPNPISHKEIQFEIADNSKDFTAQVIDSQGCIVFEQKYKAYNYGKTMTLAVPSLEMGVYFLKIENDTDLAVKKVVFIKD